MHDRPGRDVPLDRPVITRTPCGSSPGRSRPVHSPVRSFPAHETSPRPAAVYHPDEVLSAEDLLEHVWDANTDPFTTSVRVILSRLRRKLGDPSPIVTIPQVGYRLEGQR